MSNAESFHPLNEEFNNLVNETRAGATHQEFVDRVTPILYQQDVVVWNAATKALQRYGRPVLIQNELDIRNGKPIPLADPNFYTHSTGLVELSGMTSSALTPEQAAAPIDALRISSLLRMEHQVVGPVSFRAPAEAPQPVDILKPDKHPAQKLLVEHLTVSPNHPQAAPSHLEMETYGPRPGKGRLGRMLASAPNKSKLMAKAPDTVVRIHQDKINNPLGNDGFVELSRPTLPLAAAKLRTDEDVAQAVERVVAAMEESRKLYEIIGALGRSAVDIKAFKFKR